MKNQEATTIFDLAKPYCYFFNEICKIPHGSTHEKSLSDWLVQFASDRGLPSIQDEIHNVVIYKPASPGYEDHPGVIIQAHMDMVCEKTPESLHNFETDPLELFVEGDHLRAKGTTLGADDGMGCAYMLAILDDPTLPHPYLECCFTTQEEVGLVGALRLKPEYFSARQLINLDGAGEYRTYVSMGGGKRVTLKKQIEWMPVDQPAYRLMITGLRGGHSGGMIDKERANANKLAAQVMAHLGRQGIPVHLIRWVGGTKPNVIASSAEVVFASHTPPGEIQAAIAACAAAIATQYEFSDPGITIALSPEPRIKQALPEKLSQEIIELVYLLPFGQRARSIVVENLPIASVNLGVVAITAGYVEIVASIRSALDAWMVEIEQEIRLLARLHAASVEDSGYYPGWQYEKDSPLRDKMCAAFQEMYHQPLACLGGHGGNECGIFKKLHPDMDIVTSGAIYGAIHTTDEFLDLASFDRAYRFLTYFLGKL